ncbi:hypothetical protein HanRHA438_Chr15g0689471 [Helianthus annuus]|nr:hypothetical protein HanRHA438_Chr15g0689471 [Helianthus annuus]
MFLNGCEINRFVSFSVVVRLLSVLICTREARIGVVVVHTEPASFNRSFSLNIFHDFFESFDSFPLVGSLRIRSRSVRFWIRYDDVSLIERIPPRVTPAVEPFGSLLNS